MRIAMVGPFGLAPKKTMASRALGLARALVQQGDQVTLLMPPWQTPAEAGRSWQIDGVAIQYVTLSGGLPFTTRRMVNELLAWQPDVVHCFKPKAYSGFVAEWLWRFRRRQLGLVVDLDDWEGWGGWNERERYPLLAKHLFALQERWGMRHCHRLTVASRTLQTLAWSQRVPAANVCYLPNGPGIDVAGAGAGSTAQPVLLVYSRFFEFDVERLVQIIAGVQRQVPDLRVSLIGSSLQAADGQRLHHLLQRHNLSAIVDDAGWLDEAQLPQALARAAVAIYLMDDNLINRAKCPVKLADLAGVGLPIVAEHVGQVGEYVRHAENGLLRRSGDVVGLQADLVRLLQDDDLRRTLGASGRERVARHFSWPGLAAALRDCYQAALAAARR